MNTRKEIFRVPLERADCGAEQWFLVAKVTYDRGDLGGRRGYRLLISPEGKTSDGARIIPLAMGSSVFLQDAKRFNAKELERINPAVEITAELTQKVLDRWQAEELKRAQYRKENYKPIGGNHAD